MFDIFLEDRKEENERQKSLSLFDGDLVNRTFDALGFRSVKPSHLFLRILVIISITWVPMAIMAALTMPSNPTPAQNFFDDFAAYTQFFLGIPLFIIAERIIGDTILFAIRDFSESGVIADADKPRLAAIERGVDVAHKRVVPDLICLASGFVLAFMTIGPEFFTPLFTTKADMQTWHTVQVSATHRVLTWPGAWEMCVALPIQIYWWVRWIWKIGIWYWYLSKVSKFRLQLAASHPDRTGGIGFLSTVQARFAIVVLAFGISNVVSTVGYKIAIEHAPVALPPVWGPVVGFTIGAPLIFLAPLLLFTKQLYRIKKRAMSQFRERAMVSATFVEAQWLRGDLSEADQAAAVKELSQLNLLSGFYERIEGMRVVPFDLRSAGQLIASAVGPVLPLIPHFIHLPEPAEKIYEILVK